MHTRILFYSLCIVVTALIVVAAAAPSGAIWIGGALGIAALGLLAYLWKSDIKANRVVMTGMELIASQDFNNRLNTTGLHEPDKIVALFNTMIDRLRNERTKNLEQENFTRLLTQASPMGVMMLDFDRKVSMVNPAFLKITGMAAEEDAIGKKADAIEISLIKEMLKTGLGKSGVIRDGDVMMYRCYHLNFMQSGFKREFYLLESLTDEVIRAEREAYEKVIRTISHEVNNTMGGVRSVLQTMADTSDNSDVADVLESCDNRCEQMCAFVSAYADVVRLPEPMRVKSDLNEEISRIMPFLRMMTSENVELLFEAWREPVVADIDTNMMQQVMVNIVKNAAESIAPDPGRIWISTATEDGHALLEIANDGQPISEEAARNLFRPFYTTKREGRGIGLTLSAEILNRHGARYSLRTDSDGITRFRIIF